MKQKLRIFLDGIGYSCEIRRIERPSGLRFTHIRRFPAEGKLAQLCRRVDDWLCRK